MKPIAKNIVSLFTCLITYLLMGLIQPAFGATAHWSDWISDTVGNPGEANGTIALPNLNTISVDYSGEIFFAQTSGGTNYWVPSEPYISPMVENPPPDSDIVALIGGNQTVNTVTFSEPVTNPIMAILSLGRTTVPIQYEFSAPFVILSNGPGFWGDGPLTALPGNVLEGLEGHGTIQFIGSYTSISWTVPNAENWHGFTIGILSPSNASTCNDLSATIVGTPDDDILMGTSENDVIVGLDGNDVIYGLDGDDVICGGNGYDVLIGGEGNDSLFGENQADILVGGSGDDLLHGGEGNDTLHGNSGDDAMSGGEGTSVCDGGEHVTEDVDLGSCTLTVNIP